MKFNAREADERNLIFFGQPFPFFGNEPRVSYVVAGTIISFYFLRSTLAGIFYCATVHPSMLAACCAVQSPEKGKETDTLVHVRRE